jgi:hypothetical protein
MRSVMFFVDGGSSPNKVDVFQPETGRETMYRPDKQGDVAGFWIRIRCKHNLGIVQQRSMSFNSPFDMHGAETRMSLDTV